MSKMVIKGRFVFWFIIVLIILGTGFLIADWGNWTLTIAVLIVTALAFDLSFLRPPKLWISKPDELEISDLIFFLYEENDQIIPRDFLFQLHILLGNTGGTKSIITKVQITSVKDQNGKILDFPELPKRIEGRQYSRQIIWENQKQSFNPKETPPPFVLLPNDVLLLRFRDRRGIEWGKKWDIEKIAAFYKNVSIKPSHVTVEVTYRWGRDVKTISKDVPLIVEQHEKYLKQLLNLTNDFSILPAIPERDIPL